MAERSTRRALVVLLASVTLALSGCAGGAEDRGAAVSGVQGIDNHGFHGTYLEDPYVVPPVALPDTEGSSYALATAPAPLKLVFFGYTHCPDVCQVVMSTLASAVQRLDPADRARVQVVFVTTDPARDTARALRTYLDRLDRDFVGLTGTLPRITDLATPLKVYLAKGERLPSGGYEVDHSTHVYGVSGDRAQIAWPPDTSPAALATDIIKLLKS